MLQINTVYPDTSVGFKVRLSDETSKAPIRHISQVMTLIQPFFSHRRSYGMTSIKWNWQQVSRLWYKLHQKQLSTCTPLNLPQTLDTSHKREFGSIMLLFCNCGTEEASCFCGKGCTDKKKEKQNAVQIHIWIPWGHIILTFYVPHRQVILCFFNSFAEQVLGGGGVPTLLRVVLWSASMVSTLDTMLEPFYACKGGNTPRTGHRLQQRSQLDQQYTLHESLQGEGMWESLTSFD